MAWVETIVCSSIDGKDEILKRRLERRQEFKRRSNGCMAAWIGRGVEDHRTFLVHSVFESMQAWKLVSEKILHDIDSKDGGVESLLIGPPLVGIFETEQFFQEK